MSENEITGSCRTVKIYRGQPEQTECVEDTVAREHILDIYENHRMLRRMSCSDCQLEALAAGYLVSEGYVEAACDILAVKISGDRTCVYVTVPEEKELLHKREMRGAQPRRLSCSPEDLMEWSERLLTENPVFDSTGAMHSALLSDTQKQVFYSSMDLKRHNAVDKVIGEAILRGSDLSRCMLFTTGRIPSDMMWKAIYSNIAVVVSRGAVTMQAIALAEEYGIMLCGFSRGKRINIYTMQETLH